MKIGMIQMSMSEDMDMNAKKIVNALDQAKECDLVFFPEVQFSPFFAQHKDKDASKYLMRLDDPRIEAIRQKAKEHRMYISPNVYLSKEDGNYDASLWMNPEGRIEDISTMVHIYNAPYFWEIGYYTPSKDGFKVYETPFGKVGIVICFDRHIPESIRTCALMGADLVIVPTANVTNEPLDMFEWEMRVQAMHNHVSIAMCNRVGTEGEITFAGQSLLIDANGNLIYKAGMDEEIIIQELDIKKGNRPFLALRRPKMYY